MQMVEGIRINLVSKMQKMFLTQKKESGHRHSDKQGGAEAKKALKRSKHR